MLSSYCNQWRSSEPSETRKVLFYQTEISPQKYLTLISDKIHHCLRNFPAVQLHQTKFWEEHLLDMLL